MSPPLFDPRIHPSSLSGEDLETLQIFGVQAVIVVADATAHPATPSGLFAHFDHLLGVQLPRLRRSGLDAWAALGVHAAALPRRGLGQVLEALPGYFSGGRVVAVGQLGLRTFDEREQEALLEQLLLAHRFQKPALLTVPPLDKEQHTRRLLATLKRARLAPGRMLVDGVVGRTVRTVRELGFHAGLTLHPEHLEVERAVGLVRTLGPERLVLGSGAGDGSSDLLSLARAAHRLAKAGLSARVVRRVTRDNAAALFGVD